MMIYKTSVLWIGDESFYRRNCLVVRRRILGKMCNQRSVRYVAERYGMPSRRNTVICELRRNTGSAVEVIPNAGAAASVRD
jgi:hypothetical protein